MPPISKEEQKEIVKEAIKEWLNERFASFGKWTLLGVAAGLFALICKFLFLHGWDLPR